MKRWARSLTARECGAILAHDAAVRAIASLRAHRQLDLFQPRPPVARLWASVLCAALAERAR
jgi:hypothetical protein